MQIEKEKKKEIYVYIVRILELKCELFNTAVGQNERSSNEATISKFMAASALASLHSLSL